MQLLAVWNQFSFVSWVVVSAPASFRKIKTVIPWCARCLPYSSRPVLGLGWAPQPFYSSTETWNISRLRVWLFKQNQCWRGKRNAVSPPEAIQNVIQIPLIYNAQSEFQFLCRRRRECTSWLSSSHSFSLPKCALWEEPHLRPCPCTTGVSCTSRSFPQAVPNTMPANYKPCGCSLSARL